MEMSRKIVRKRNGDKKWEPIRRGGKKCIMDALMSDSYHKWNPLLDFHLGGHLMNDLDFDTPSNTTPPNCIVQPLMEVVTARDVKKDEELFISYNRN